MSWKLSSIAVVTRDCILAWFAHCSGVSRFVLPSTAGSHISSFDTTLRTFSLSRVSGASISLHTSRAFRAPVDSVPLWPLGLCTSSTTIRARSLSAPNPVPTRPYPRLFVSVVPDAHHLSRAVAAPIPYRAKINETLQLRYSYLALGPCMASGDGTGFSRIFNTDPVPEVGTSPGLISSSGSFIHMMTNRPPCQPRIGQLGSQSPASAEPFRAPHECLIANSAQLDLYATPLAIASQNRPPTISRTHVEGSNETDHVQAERVRHLGLGIGTKYWNFRDVCKAYPNQGSSIMPWDSSLS
jgi:hypothetical protein